jgi:hypothetical protein
MLKPNIITQFCMFFTLAILINFLNLKALLLLLSLVILLLLMIRSYQFIPTLRRFRWFFSVMLLIFAFNTPGEHVATWPLTISPTYEGIALGGRQLIRIVVMLLAISLLMATNTKQELISGFYFLFLPLQYFGIKVERFAARLWLTLHYVELNTQGGKVDFTHRLNEMIGVKSAQLTGSADEGDIKRLSDIPPDTVELIVPQFCVQDCLVIALLLFTLIRTFA